MAINPRTGVDEPDVPTCVACEFAEIGLVGIRDRCKHENNARGAHPVALRKDANLCGHAAVWFSARVTPVTDPDVKNKVP